MKSSMFRLNTRDFIKGIVVVIMTAALTLFVQLLQTKGFDLTGADWQQIGTVAVTAAIGYLMKNLVSDENDQVLGKI